MSDEQIKLALDALEASDCAMGKGWETAHNIVQAHEGEVAFDRIHALLHRIEGDSFNANYWYRRAGVAPFSGSKQDELAMLEAELMA